MSNPIAVYSGDTVLYWSAIIITLGLLAALMMTRDKVSCTQRLSSYW